MEPAENLWLEFLRDGICGLCGNWGWISHVVWTPAGAVRELDKASCICPNGRSFKATGGVVGVATRIDPDA